MATLPSSPADPSASAKDRRRVDPKRVAATVAAVALATLLRWSMRGALSDNVPFVFYYPVIMLAAWFAGSLCASLAMVLAASLTSWLFIDARGDPLAWLRILLFVAGSIFIIWISAMVKGARLDLIEARRHEEAQKRWFERMLDSVAEGVIATDVDGRISFVNRAAYEMTGSAPERALGMPLFQMLVIQNTETKNQVKEIAAFDAQTQGFSLLAPERDEVPISVTVAPLRLNGDVTSGTVLIFRLAFEERDRALLAAEAQTARDDAQAADRMKDDFLRMVSHELRAPLNAILGWADVMLKKNDAATVTKGSETIRRNVRAQSSLIDSMLDVSAIASGKFNVDRRPIDLKDVVEEAHRSIEPTAQSKNIQIPVVYPETMQIVSADPTRLQQVLANLYSNALKFTPSGGTIRTTLAYAKDHVTITVEDSGQGMSPETAALLFERSSNAQSPLQRSKSGLGLGLRIARRIVELHGGDLGARSPGEHLGTICTVTLPINDSASKPAQDSEAAPLARLLGKKILVVDDDTQAALLVSNILEDLGAKVQSADGARRALDLYQRWQPDGIISDLGMPQEDGNWLMREIRLLEQRDARARIPALAVTAYTRPEDRERSRQAGFDGHLAKPVTARAVAYALAEAMTRIDPTAPSGGAKALGQ